MKSIVKSPAASDVVIGRNVRANVQALARVKDRDARNVIMALVELVARE